MTTKLSASEILRRACISAEQNELSFAESVSNDAKLYEETMDYVRQLRAYRIKRWGRSRLEKQLDAISSVPFTEIIRRST